MNIQFSREKKDLILIDRSVAWAPSDGAIPPQQEGLKLTKFPRGIWKALDEYQKFISNLQGLCGEDFSPSMVAEASLVLLTTIDRVDTSAAIASVVTLEANWIAAHDKIEKDSSDIGIQVKSFADFCAAL
jgi:hypothetical protein